MKYFYLLMLGLSMFANSDKAFAQAEEERSPQKNFYTLWKSFKPELKLQFITGYLQGWSDAESIHKLAVDAAEKDPSTITTTLETLTPLYDTSEITPKSLIEAIDEYYKDENLRGSPLAKVIAASRAKISAKAEEPVAITQE